MKSRPYSLLKEISIGLIILCVISAPFIARLGSEPFNPDENTYIKSSRLFKLFFIDKDFYNREWKQQFYDPPLFKYLIGLVLFISCDKHEIGQLDNMPLWDWGKDHEWNEAQGAMPPDKILYISRLCVAISGVFTCLLIYWIGRMVFGVKTGIIASLLLAYNPLMLGASRKAMTGTTSLFFLTATIAMTVLFFHFFILQKFRRSFVFAVLIGIGAALATGTKLSGALSMVIFAGLCILIIFTKVMQCGFSLSAFYSCIAKLKDDRGIKIIILSLFTSGIIAVCLFIITNPYLYGKTIISGLIRMIEDNAKISYLQQIEQPLKALMSLNKKFSFVVHRTLLSPGYVTMGKIFKIPLDLVFFLSGLAMLLYDEIKFYFKFHRLSLNSVIIIWVTVVFIGITIWIPLDWRRYYLTIIPCVAMVSGFCLGRIIDEFSQIVKKLYLKTKCILQGVFS